MSATFAIHEGAVPGAYVPRGAALDLWRYKGQEAMISGPAETGKTLASLHKLDALLWKYPRSQAVMVRKVRDTIRTSCLQTYTRKVLGETTPVRAVGGESPSAFDYPNGSRLWLAGMDDPQKVLSSERDFVYVNQAEELALDDWETLLTRCTGRAENSPYPQVLADCNPGPPHHWIRHRATLKVFESRHEDNPTLWDADRGEWTPQGVRTLAALDSLTGVRRERLRFGRWVAAEGTVYDFDAAAHLVDPFPIPGHWTRFRSIDFGFTNPFACLWLAVDPDGRLVVYRELYMTGRTVKVHADRIKELSRGETYAATVADHDAEDRATLHENGIHTVAARKAIKPGIEAVAERLKPAGDGKPRLVVFRSCLAERDEALAAAKRPVCLRDEFDAYQWPKAADGRPVKDVPVDLNNHALDALRYGVMWADHRGRSADGWLAPTAGQTLTGMAAGRH